MSCWHIDACHSLHHSSIVWHAYLMLPCRVLQIWWIIIWEWINPMHMLHCERHFKAFKSFQHASAEFKAPLMTLMCFTRCQHRQCARRTEGKEALYAKQWGEACVIAWRRALHEKWGDMSRYGSTYLSIDTMHNEKRYRSKDTQQDKEICVNSERKAKHTKKEFWRHKGSAACMQDTKHGRRESLTLLIVAKSKFWDTYEVSAARVFPLADKPPRSQLWHYKCYSFRTRGSWYPSILFPAKWHAQWSGWWMLWYTYLPTSTWDQNKSIQPSEGLLQLFFAFQTQGYPVCQPASEQFQDSTSIHYYGTTICTQAWSLA